MLCILSHSTPLVFTHTSLRRDGPTYGWCANPCPRKRSRMGSLADSISLCCGHDLGKMASLGQPVVTAFTPASVAPRGPLASLCTHSRTTIFFQRGKWGFPTGIASLKFNVPRTLRPHQRHRMGVSSVRRAREDAIHVLMRGLRLLFVAFHSRNAEHTARKEGRSSPKTGKSRTLRRMRALVLASA